MSPWRWPTPRERRKSRCKNILLLKMALSELNAAIPEKLPVKFAYNELGHRFESVQSNRLVQLLPQGAQPFGPKHTRLIRFDLTATSGDYLLPESVRLQANFP